MDRMVGLSIAAQYKMATEFEPTCCSKDKSDVKLNTLV